jgi:tripartite ATP-independent transporter DctP family solute receptor
MMLKKRVIKPLAIAAGLLLSANVMAANFKMSVGDGEGSAQQVMGQKFAELLAEKTNNKHKAKLFLNGQLGSEQDTVNDAAIGTLDFSVLASNNLAPFSPTVGMLSLPYIFESLDQAAQTVQGPVGQELMENTLRDAGVRILGWTFSGFRVLSNSKKPVTQLSDLKGMVIRVPKNEIMIDTYKSWGINPTPMAWTETFTALQQRVVDGQDTPYTTIYSMKFGEVQKYITDLHYLFLLEPLIVSEAVFQDQNKKTQQAMLAAGQEATAYSLDWLKKKESQVKQELVSKYGMELNTLSDEAAWAAAAQKEVWPKFYDSVGGKEKINALLKSLGRDQI